jgi:hypothetical protein
LVLIFYPRPSVVHQTIYKTVTLPPAAAPNSLEQTDAHGTFRQRRFAAFSPGEKVSAGRMRGKSARPTKVYPLSETSQAIRFLSVSIGRPSLGSLLPIIGSVVKSLFVNS